MTCYLLEHLAQVLSLPGIAGYEWVPARIGLFIKTKYFFHNTNGQLNTGKMGTHSSADTSSVQCSLPCPDCTSTEITKPNSLSCSCTSRNVSSRLQDVWNKNNSFSWQHCLDFHTPLFLYLFLLYLYNFPCFNLIMNLKLLLKSNCYSWQHCLDFHTTLFIFVIP